MNSPICQLLISFQLPNRAILLSPRLMNKWGLQNDQQISLTFGNKSVIVKVRKQRHPGLRITLSPALRQQLAIPYVKSTRAIFEDSSLRLGPVIGILTTGFTGNSQQPFGSRSHLFRHFIKEGASERPFIYVFTPEMIDWKSETVQGWYYYKNNWISRSSPLPDVIYERVPNRKVESHTHVQNCLQRLRTRSNCQIFNQGFFNKWSIHQLLGNHPQTYTFFPETHLSPSIETIEKMIQKHRAVYLKPSGGSLGLGIFRITHIPGKGYFCRYHQGSRNVLRRFKSIRRLISYYFGDQSRRFHTYIVQQGIQLIKYHGRPVDFRLHLHKDATGDWQVVAIGCKMAGSGCVTTHVRTGGSIVPTSKLLQEICGERSSWVENQLKSAAVEIASVLEQQVEGPLGELGLDIGLDTDMQIWLFEINAKPGRHIFDHPTLREAGRQSAKFITDYSLKLANFV
ncbi:YheC/D like ATP-grasp [Seinonella peptonophila]|uniref:YheC/D like ATP-grasp n=1 Tax=Seinonella peptonophila TaxID=112248 RepID=A0A1M4W4R9_9BACL|nr:YheC/YheD family protein [Seinonella peptonophila]SHE76251.1 YheC/D like ATP-grasp [Seinonella peptonophila]